MSFGIGLDRKEFLNLVGALGMMSWPRELLVFVVVSPGAEPGTL
jgi:hypothetical protein